MLASINEYGVASFQQVYANNILACRGGHLLDGYVELKPRGMVAYGIRRVRHAAAAAPTWTRLPGDRFRRRGRAGPTRSPQYGEIESTFGCGRGAVLFQTFDGGDHDPDRRHGHVSAAACSPPPLQRRPQRPPAFTSCCNAAPKTSTPGTHRLLWAFKAIEGTATMRGADGPNCFYVEDIGPTDFYENIAVRQRRRL